MTTDYHFEFYKKGFDVMKGDEIICYIPYYSISKIKPVHIEINYKNYDYLFERFTGENVSKYCYFEIILTNGDIVTIYSNLCEFARLDKKSWKTIFYREGLCESAKKFLNDKKFLMNFYYVEMNEIREKLIEQINIHL